MTLGHFGGLVDHPGRVLAVAGRSGQQHAALGLVDDVAGGLPHERVAQPLLAAVQDAAAQARGLLRGQHDRLDAAALGLAHDRLAGPAGAHDRRRHLDALVLLADRLGAGQRLPGAFELGVGHRRVERSAIGTSNTHSASITAPPSPPSSFSSAASRPAVWTMSSSSGKPEIGTRIEPYSASCRLRREHGLGDADPLQQRLVLGDAVVDVDEDPERHPPEADPACAGVEGEHGDEGGAGDQRPERRRERQVTAADAHVERHPVRAVTVRLAVAQAADRQADEREGDRRAERRDAEQELEVGGEQQRGSPRPRRCR